MFRPMSGIKAKAISKRGAKIAGTAASAHLEALTRTQNKVVAISNNDTAFAAWQYREKLADCLGFAVYRTDLSSGLTAPLPAWVGFSGESNDDWKPRTTEQWPIQKFSWRDLTAKRGGFYQYRIVPMIGKPGDLQPRDDLAVTSNAVHLSPERGAFSTYFNRGILSTQHLVHQIPAGPTGSPNYKQLTNRIDQPGDPLREDLAGDILQGLKLLLDRAKREGGQCYGALYELGDTELEQELIGSPYVHLVLSNTGKDDGENMPTRQALHESNVDVTDRMLPDGHIGHNKFMVYVNSEGKPQAVLTGSTNWTSTGLCAQSNNALVIDSPVVAGLYFDYYNRLKQDTKNNDNGRTDGQARLQGLDFRTHNNQPNRVTMEDGHSDLTIWFSPNTKATSKSSGSPTPSDMAEVFEVMKGAKQAILFLAFQPGSPSIVDQAAACQNDNKDLFVRGAITDPKAVGQYETDLYHRSGSKPDASVVAASAINDQFSFWHRELLKSSPTAHAIIHDKIVVVDPFSSDCAVITGSHNLGFRASYNNDENMVIVRHNRALAEAYATHVLDVYEHYRWRYMIQKDNVKAWACLSVNDSWQDRYFDKESEAQKDFRFWAGVAI